MAGERKTGSIAGASARWRRRDAGGLGSGSDISDMDRILRSNQYDILSK
jgi:hypothetical protein